jgi:hypothetical protein
VSRVNQVRRCSLRRCSEWQKVGNLN